jgi:hypothetical protein
MHEHLITTTGMRQQLHLKTTTLMLRQVEQTKLMLEHVEQTTLMLQQVRLMLEIEYVELDQQHDQPDKRND